MKNKILNREDAIKLLNETDQDVIYINQATAGRILNVSRQRIKQYIKHAAHAERLGVTFINNKPVLNLALVLKFTNRSNYRGKRGPQKIRLANTQITV